MKINELKNLTLKELENNETDLYRKVFELKCKKATNQLSKTHELKQAKKDIARVKTLLQMKQHEGKE